MAGKGKPKTGGRAIGSTNKLTADVKSMVLDALEQAGGVGYLLLQSQSNPNAFMALVGKVLPLTVAGDAANPLYSVIERRIVRSAD